MSDIRHSLLRRDALSAAKEVLYHLDIYFSSQLQSGPLPLVDKGPAELLEEFLFQVPKERGAPPKVGPHRRPAESEAWRGPGRGWGRSGPGGGPGGCRREASSALGGRARPQGVAAEAAGAPGRSPGGAAAGGRGLGRTGRALWDWGGGCCWRPRPERTGWGPRGAGD